MIEQAESDFDSGWDMSWFDTSPRQIIDFATNECNLIEEICNLNTYNSVVIMTDLLLSKVQSNLSNNIADKLIVEYAKVFGFCRAYGVEVTVRSAYSSKRLELLPGHVYFYNKFISCAGEYNVRCLFEKSTSLQNTVARGSDLPTLLAALYDIPAYYIVMIIKAAILGKFLSIESIKISVIVALDCINTSERPISDIDTHSRLLLVNDIINSDLFTFENFDSQELVITPKALEILELTHSRATELTLARISQVLYRHYSSETIDVLVTNRKYNKFVESNRICYLYNNPEICDVILRECSKIVYIEGDYKATRPRESCHILFKDLLAVTEHITLLLRKLSNTDSIHELTIINKLQETAKFIKYQYFKSKLDKLNSELVMKEDREKEQESNNLDKAINELIDQEDLTIVENDMVSLHSIIIE